MPALPEFWRFDNIFWSRFLERNFREGEQTCGPAQKQKGRHCCRPCLGL